MPTMVSRGHSNLGQTQELCRLLWAVSVHIWVPLSDIDCQEQNDQRDAKQHPHLLRITPDFAP